MKISYPVNDTVSVWVGTFESEDAFDLSVDKAVEPQLGLKKPITSICEIAHESKPVSVRSLVEGFSGWETFIESVELAARAAGITTATSALVCYYVRCESAPLNWGGLSFLGSFGGRDSA